MLCFVKKSFIIVEHAYAMKVIIVGNLDVGASTFMDIVTVKI